MHYQAILDQPGMDIWSAANGGTRLDVRVARDDAMRLKQLGLHCTTLHESVEQLVRKFEKSLSVKQEWFEEYVSIAINYRSISAFIAVKLLIVHHLSNSIHMMISLSGTRKLLLNTASWLITYLPLVSR